MHGRGGRAARSMDPARLGIERMKIVVPHTSAGSDEDAVSNEHRGTRHDGRSRDARASPDGDRASGCEGREDGRVRQSSGIAVRPTVDYDLVPQRDTSVPRQRDVRKAAKPATAPDSYAQQP